MHSAQPLDILFEEAGASLGRIERELRLKDEAREARLEARLAAIELTAFKAEEERQRKFEVRMSELRDGRDGEPGKDGKDADIQPLRDEVGDFLSKAHETISLDLESLRDSVEDKLAEVKDGKDGEPGRDGKDADIKPLIDMFEAREERLADHFDELESTIKSRVDARLCELKDGKDGESGKDADISGVVAQFKKHEAFILDCVERSQSEIQERLAEVKDGKDGEQGPPGKDGKDGQDGKMPIAREWTNRVHYAGDVVRHNGSTYQALTDTGRQPPDGDWGELASRGTDGIGFVLRGTYDASAEYRQHDIVMINRNSFAAKYDNPGECPGDGWTLFAASGQRGKEGPPGPRGLQGPEGRSLSIVSLDVDPDAMRLRITDSSGNIYVGDLQPIAERILEAAR